MAAFIPEVVNVSSAITYIMGFKAMALQCYASFAKVSESIPKTSVNREIILKRRLDGKGKREG